MYRVHALAVVLVCGLVALLLGGCPTPDEHRPASSTVADTMQEIDPDQTVKFSPELVALFERTSGAGKTIALSKFVDALRDTWVIEGQPLQAADVAAYLEAEFGAIDLTNTTPRDRLLLCIRELNGGQPFSADTRVGFTEATYLVVHLATIAAANSVPPTQEPSPAALVKAHIRMAASTADTGRFLKDWGAGAVKGGGVMAVAGITFGAVTFIPTGSAGAWVGAGIAAAGLADMGVGAILYGIGTALESLGEPFELTNEDVTRAVSSPVERRESDYANVPPVAEDQIVPVQLGQKVQFLIGGHDSDEYPRSFLTYTLVSYPANGSLEYFDRNTLTWTVLPATMVGMPMGGLEYLRFMPGLPLEGPHPEPSCWDQARFTVNDGEADSQTGTVTFSLQALPAELRLLAPANNAQNIPTASVVSLEWEPVQGTVSYHVYYGGDPANMVWFGSTEGSHMPLPAPQWPSTTCYWKVIAKNDAGITDSDTWSFTTSAAPADKTLWTGSTQGKAITIVLGADPAASADGDQVDALLNGVTFRSNLELAAAGVQVQQNLRDGSNRLEIVARNADNKGFIAVYMDDLSGRPQLFSSTWSLSAGQKAVVLIDSTIQAAVPSISSFAINNGAASTTSTAVTLNNTCTGSPTHYMASESSSFSGAAWQTYGTAPSFTLSSGNGTKTVYFKVKNTTGESATASDTITATTGGTVDMEFVTVGNPGNVGELSGSGAGGYGPDCICGAVAYIYKIGKYEVTAGEYCEFLNAVAATDTHWLYNIMMWSEDNGCKIQRSGSPGSYTYSVAADWANRPVNYVSKDDAKRFCNWLTNGKPTGAQGLSTTEDGSYDLNSAGSGSRKIGARYVIPTEDEWYKAAYHKNDGVTPNYYDYPTCSNNAPTNTLSGSGANNANFSYTLGSPYYRTEVGAFAGSPSAYGTFDQGGNVWEWNDAWYGAQIIIRGGSFDLPGHNLRASARNYVYFTQANGMIGFRVAEIP